MMLRNCLSGGGGGGPFWSTTPRPTPRARRGESELPREEGVPYTRNAIPKADEAQKENRPEDPALIAIHHHSTKAARRETSMPATPVPSQSKLFLSKQKGNA